MFSFETLASWEQRFCLTPWFTLCACQSVFLCLLCPSLLPLCFARGRWEGKEGPPGHEAPCSQGEELEREMKRQQFKEEIKTKLNLLSHPPLKPCPGLGPACSAHTHKQNFHQSFLYGCPLQKGWNSHILPVSRWRSRHPVLLAGMNPAAPGTGSNSQPCPPADPLRSERCFFI